MVWAIILITIAFIIGRFLFDWKEQNKKLVTEGGLRTKYAELIRTLQSNSNPQVFKSDIDTYSFGWTSPNADSRFIIMQTFGSVTIKWVFKGRIVFENKTINLSKEWNFSESDNQEQMAEKVLKEITEIINNSELGKYS